MTEEERKRRIVALENYIRSIESSFETRRKKRNLMALLFLSALWFVFLYITGEITNILILLISIPASLIFGGFSYYLIILFCTAFVFPTGKDKSAIEKAKLEIDILKRL